jgi:hypothetical protein
VFVHLWRDLDEVVTAMLVVDAFPKDMSAGLESGTAGARRFLVGYMFLVVFTYGCVS